jgi:hypothetical protein
MALREAEACAKFEGNRLKNEGGDAKHIYTEIYIHRNIHTSAL